MTSLPTTQPPTLASIQQLFWKLIAHPVGVAQFLAEADQETRRVVDATFGASDEFPLVERLEVYAQGYFFRIRDVLAELFPVVNWQLGDVGFHNVVTDYVLAHPSTDPDLSRVGDALPEFLSDRSEAPALAQIAAVELSVRRALDAPDGTPLTAAELTAVPPDAWSTLRFEALPHVSLHVLDWDYGALRQHQRRQSEPTTSLVQQTRLQSAHTLVVWRRGFEVFTRILASEEGSLLTTLLDGATFGEMCEQAQQRNVGEAAVASYLLSWIRGGLLAARR